MFSEHATIQMYKAKKTDLEAQLVENSMSLNLKQMHSSNEISKIHAKYSSEEELIRNKIKGLDNKSGNDEYRALLMELEDLKDQEDREVSQVESASKAYEERITAENTTLQTQVQSITADLEQWESVRKENIERLFGYAN